MLQQTQVERVLPKYREFLDKFPTLQALADAGQLAQSRDGLFDGSERPEKIAIGSRCPGQLSQCGASCGRHSNVNRGRERERFRTGEYAR